MNGALYIFGGESPARAVDAIDGMECLDPLSLHNSNITNTSTVGVATMKQQQQQQQQQQQSSFTLRHSAVSFTEALPEQNLVRFHTVQHEEYLYVTGGRYTTSMPEVRTASRRNHTKSDDSPQVYRLQRASFKGASKGGFTGSWYMQQQQQQVGASDVSGGGGGSNNRESVYAIETLPRMSSGRYGHA